MANINDAIKKFIEKGLTVDQLVLLIPDAMLHDKIVSTLSDPDIEVFKSKYGDITVMRSFSLAHMELIERPDTINLLDDKISYKSSKGAVNSYSKLKSKKMNSKKGVQ